MKNFDTVHTYRQTAPDAENHSGGGASPPPVEEPAPPVEEPAAVAPEAPEPEPTSVPEEESLWESLAKDSDDDDDNPPEDLPSEDSTPPEPTPEEKPPEAPAVEETPATPETPAEPEVTAADTAAPTEEPVEQPTSQPEPEPTPQPTADEILTQQKERRANLEGQLTNHFKLTEQEALQLVTNPGEVFPKLQARMFTDMWMGVEKMIQQAVPDIVRNTSSQMEVQNEAVDGFFKAWPKLDRKIHGKQIAQVAKVYSQINPNATQEEVTKNVGMQVMFMNGIAPDVQSEVPPEATPAETPATPYKPPAVNGAPSAPQQSSGNLYTDYAEELLNDED